ncbi:MAG: hypothetical protein LBT82_00920 [Oscillospiraceae bacterium]|jgi:hydroxymethylpyrimidine pyrophosphatase-like HAD family hydrolase|nr:hypothetical protein [Oscillospiraceae bacterium]
MEDMLGRIIEIDKKAREALELVQKDRLNLEQEIVQLKKKIREKYFERAQKRLDKNKALEEEHANCIIKKIYKKRKDKIEKLDESYKKNCEIWVSKLCERVLKI